MTPRDPRVVAMALNLYHHNIESWEWFPVWWKRRFPDDPLPTEERIEIWQARFRGGFSQLSARFDPASFEAHLEIVLERYADEAAARVDTWDWVVKHDA